MKYICKFILWVCGWKYIGKAPDEKKYVVISVPHTSMWDFVWGKIAFCSQGVKPIIFIKKESFFFPLGILLRALGARPVNRQKGAPGLIEQIISYFNNNDICHVCITPEGTRKKVTKWKKGFYYIAYKANVPVYLGIVDYKQKHLNIGERFLPTGDIETDMKYICQYYNKLKPQAKYPNMFDYNIQ